MHVALGIINCLIIIMRYTYVDVMPIDLASLAS